MPPSLTVIVPTLGRQILARALESCRGADRVLVVADGPEALRGALSTWEAAGLPGAILGLPERSGGPGGGGCRQYALPLALPGRVSYLDDDDLYREGAVDLLRNSKGLVVFRMQYDNVQAPILWTEPRAVQGQIGTPMICHDHDRHGTWSRRYECDFDFFVSTASLYPRVEWREEIIATVTPPRQP